MTAFLLRSLFGLMAFFLVSTASAHRLGESYIYLNVTDQALSGRYEVTLTDLAKVGSFDADADGVVSETEFNAAAARVYAYLQPRLRFYHQGSTHGVQITGHDFLHLDTATFALVRFEVPSLGVPPEKIEAEYRFLFDREDPTHRGLLVIESNTRSGIKDNESQVSAIFGPGDERKQFNLEGVQWQDVFLDFVAHGAWHIWIGFDHILFLIALLLPSVLFLRSGNWEPVGTFREAFFYVLKVVTLFTVAHTITLSLAALKIVEMPSQWVESIIAISIAVVALNNLYPFLRGKSWLIVFFFGLFHGLGFANVLAPLGVSPQSTTSALLGFNLGVELGQIAIVLLVFPLLYLAREQAAYRTVFLKLSSFALIGISLFWFVERTVDVPFVSADMFSMVSTIPVVTA